MRIVAKVDRVERIDADAGNVAEQRVGRTHAVAEETRARAAGENLELANQPSGGRECEKASMKHELSKLTNMNEQTRLHLQTSSKAKIIVAEIAHEPMQ